MEKIIDAIYLQKRLRRQGWIRNGIPLAQVESIAEHSYGTSIIALLLGIIHNSKVSKEEQLDIGKLVMMTLLHDLPEALYMDFDNSIDKLIGKEAIKFKKKIDTKAIEELISTMQEGRTFVNELLAPVDSLEKEFLLYADKLELLCQAIEYKNTGIPETCLNDFFTSIHEFFSSNKVESVNNLYSIITQRNKSNK